jgi:hypothetical protein
MTKREAFKASLALATEGNSKVTCRSLRGGKSGATAHHRAVALECHLNGFLDEGWPPARRPCPERVGASVLAPSRPAIRVPRHPRLKRLTPRTPFCCFRVVLFSRWVAHCSPPCRVCLTLAMCAPHWRFAAMPTMTRRIMQLVAVLVDAGLPVMRRASKIEVLTPLGLRQQKIEVVRERIAPMHPMGVQAPFWSNARRDRSRRPSHASSRSSSSSAGPRERRFKRHVLRIARQ